MGVCPGPWMVPVEEVKGGEEEARRRMEEGDGGRWALDRLEQRGRRMTGPPAAPSNGATLP